MIILLFSNGEEFIVLLDLTVADHRYDAVVRATEQSQTEARAYLITGHLDEKNFIQHWEEKVIFIERKCFLSI